MALWAYREVMDLIGLYKEEPVLWDPNHPEYEHEIKSNEAWERITAGMGPDYKVEGLKLKMFSLKRMYHQHKRENTFPYINLYDNKYFHRLDLFLGKTSTYVTTADSTQVEKVGDTEGVKVKDAGVPQQEDVCSLYAKLLAEKLRQLPELDRHNFMLEIDGMFVRHLQSSRQ